MSVADVLPPSPPTTSSRKDANLPRASFSLPGSMKTPDDSPASLPGSSINDSRKKVEFSSVTATHHAPTFVLGSNQAASVKALPPSRECQPLARSILKPSSQTEPVELGMDGQQEEKLSMNETMDSILQQLNKNDKSTSIDAYCALASLLKAYDEVPEAIVLKNKINSIAKAIRRDLTSQDKSGPALTDANLLIQALKVLIILVWNKEFSQLLTDEYRAFILDRSIHVIHEHTAPKTVIVHYLHLLSTQDFRHSMITSNTRATRLLDALREVQKHVPGNAATGERLLVYSRLLDQAKPAMKMKANCWTEDLLMAMVSPIKDTRAKGITFGMKACSAFGSSSSVSDAVKETLAQNVGEKRTIDSYLCRRLESMATSNEAAIHVPQIWAIVLLLVNGTDNKIETWPSLRPWLSPIQRCFNCGDTTVRHQANLAWNRFICVARPHEASKELASMLGRPILAQLERPTRDKQGRNTRASALSSYCNLLYYGFRPAATHEQYTEMWNEYIVKVMKRSFFEKHTANADFACRIFMVLMWNSSRTTKVWRESRAHDNIPVEPEELPTIDSKWLRSKAGKILQMFKVVFRHSSWGPNNPPDQAYVATAWRHFAKALGEASSKEIKPSSETVQACIHVLKFEQELWEDGPQAVNAPKDAASSLSDRLVFLTRVMVAELGVATVVESLERSKLSLPAVLLGVIMSAALPASSISQNVLPRLDEALVSKPSTNLLPLLGKLLPLFDKLLSEAYSWTVDQHDGIEAVVEILSQCLQNPTPSTRILCLQKMEKSLLLWLRDRDRQMSPSDDAGFGSMNPAKRIARLVITALGDALEEALNSLDSLMAAGFSSAHKEIVNRMIEMWNKNHGRLLKLNYGPLLTEALVQLRPYVHLDLPGFPQQVSSQLVPEPAFFQAQHEDKQNEKTMQEQVTLHTAVAEQRELDPSNRKLGIGRGEISEIVEDSRLFQPTASLFQAQRSTPQGRRRQDDSQVQFSTIDSSPPAAMEQGSSLLIDRQKDVRDKQRMEAAVFFPDLKPSVGPKSEHVTKAMGELSRRALAQERPTTPTLSTSKHHDFDHAPTASPTPRSKSHLMRLEDIEVPSSPPSIPGHLDNTTKGRITAISIEDVDRGFVNNAVFDHDIAMDEDEPAIFAPSPCNESAAQDVIQSAGFGDFDFDKFIEDDLPSTVTAKESSAHLDVRHDTSLKCIDKETFEDDLEATGGDTEDIILGPPLVEVVERVAQLPKSEESHAICSGQEETGEFVSSQSETDSSELDLMSQSQLSQDLDLHVAGETGEFPAQPREHLLVRTARRKRKSTWGDNLGLKRRKSRSSSKSVSVASRELEDEEEDHGLIIVDTSYIRPARVRKGTHRETHKGEEGSSLQNLEDVSDDLEEQIKEWSEASAFELLPPEMAVKRQTDSPESFPIVQPDVSNGPIQTQEETTPESPVQREETFKAVVEITRQESEPAEDPAPLQDQERPPDAKDIMNEDVGKEEQTSCPPRTDIVSKDKSMEEITTSLLHVLERLKGSDGEEVDLRTIDDLCFKIRTEGQNAFQRWTRNESQQ